MQYRDPTGMRTVLCNAWTYIFVSVVIACVTVVYRYSICSVFVTLACTRALHVNKALWYEYERKDQGPKKLQTVPMKKTSTGTGAGQDLLCLQLLQ